MGSPDPVPFSYNSMAGADVKFYRPINKNVSAKDMINGNPIDPKDWQHDDCIFAIDYSTENNQGTMTKIVFDQQNEFPGPVDLLMVANNEYGAQSRSALLGVREKSRHIAMSIDDSVIQETVNIWFDKVMLWTQVRKFVQNTEEEEQE